ncbi:sigma-70 family RNA polymerase sigma factor [uncultured Erythrobacter sp.]|uniref:sigma-70 family RNA polymerase sigma factor n=1 Tax=uncultured Erythrobacter sp. TaxID=263913 RepID=UPI00262250C1|nr:sigma-70 family RNA polymerase sigma factor [uncultured Erythrobacter sp.]
MTALRSGDGLRLLIDDQREEAAEWRRLRSTAPGDARKALFARYREFTRRTALKEFGRIVGMGLESSDCVHEAYEALLASIERFDPDRGIAFTIYARPRIRGAIRNALAKATEARASFNARKRAERDRLTSLKRKNKTGSEEEQMEALREVVVGMALGFILEDNADEEANNVASEAPSAFDGAAWKQMANALSEKLANLPDPEHSVMDYHYKQGLRFAEIASLLGLSRGRISQIHSKALARMRKSIAKFR